MSTAVAKKFICSVCGYVHEGDTAPSKCPQCGVPSEKFNEVQSQELAWADEHKIGVAKGLDSEVVDGLKAHFAGECTEIGMYLAMSRQADRQGFPEVAEAYKRIAFEEAEHAAKFGELLGEVLSESTQKNLEMRMMAGFGFDDECNNPFLVRSEPAFEWGAGLREGRKRQKSLLGYFGLSPRQLEIGRAHV